MRFVKRGIEIVVAYLGRFVWRADDDHDFPLR